MADLYATIDTAGEDVQAKLADVLELRAADSAQRAMLDDYLADLELADGARVLEIGCGTGAVCRVIAALPAVGDVVGIDPSPVFVERAVELAGGADGLSFVSGDGRELPFEDGSFDAVVCHTSLCHIPGPKAVLAEAARVAADGGQLAVFDGDYVTTTVSIMASDPVQSCVDAAMGALVHDPWLVRRLPALVTAAGWKPIRMRSHGYLETDDPGYTLTLIDRGADFLLADGQIGSEAAEGLKSEARRRADEGRYFGHIAYASLIARRA